MFDDDVIKDLIDILTKQIKMVSDDRNFRNKTLSLNYL